MYPGEYVKPKIYGNTLHPNIWWEPGRNGFEIPKPGRAETQFTDPKTEMGPPAHENGIKGSELAGGLALGYVTDASGYGHGIQL